MPGLTEEEKQWLARTLGTAPAANQPAPAVPGTLPPSIAGVAYPASFTRGGLRVNIPPPPQEVQRQQEVAESKARGAEESAARRQLLKKAADQKLQLEQGIALFNKIFDEHHTPHPPI